MHSTGTLQITTPSDREIVITRDFNAPRRFVFDAMTKPELISRWMFGPPGWSFVVCEVDLRVGGPYRFVWRGPDGMEMGMGGTYLEIEAPAKLVATEKFDGFPGEALDTNVFTEENGRTTLTITVLYDSKESRDGALNSGMEAGMAAAYDRLDGVLAEMAAV